MPWPFDGDPVFVTEIDDHARGSLMDVLGIQPGHRPRQHCVTDRKPIDRDLILSDPVTSVACVESERVDTGAASKKVISLAADQGLVSAALLQGVGAPASHQTITVCQAVISATADQRVRTDATNQCVAAVSPPKEVGTRSPVDTVICAQVERDAGLPKQIGIRGVIHDTFTAGQAAVFGRSNCLASNLTTQLPPVEPVRIAVSPILVNVVRARVWV